MCSQFGEFEFTLLLTDSFRLARCMHAWLSFLLDLSREHSALPSTQHCRSIKSLRRGKIMCGFKRVVSVVVQAYDSVFRPSRVQPTTVDCRLFFHRGFGEHHPSMLLTSWPTLAREGRTSRIHFVSSSAVRSSGGAFFSAVARWRSFGETSSLLLLNCVDWNNEKYFT